MTMQKLNVMAFAIAAGVSWGLYMLFLGWISVGGYGAGIVQTLSSLYIGFEPGLLGGIIGGLLGFIDGAIGGAILAFVYNLIAKKK